MQHKILVAMSGGVDSSVSAYLLKEKGYEVAGVTMRLGLYAGSGDQGKYNDAKATEDARTVCAELGIPHFVFDFSSDLNGFVIDDFIAEYRKGRTPNPCIQCNRCIKFGTLFKKTQSLGFDMMATGHYADVTKVNGQVVLRCPEEKKKDQTYFLYGIRKEVLPNILFPLAPYTKKQVREIAQSIRLKIAEIEESQDICFIRGSSYREFINQHLGGSIRSGDIVDREGNMLGRHKGIASYTIGQRGGLGISARTPLYVIALDAVRNQVVVGEKKLLYARRLCAGNINLHVDDVPRRVTAKIRYAHKAAPCTASVVGDSLKVIFDEPQNAITPGQSVVLYDNNIVLGGGIIEEVDGEEK